MINIKKLLNLTCCVLTAWVLVACSSRTDLCDHPDLNLALKKALILDLKDWQKNADYAGIDHFEEAVSATVEGIEIIKTSYEGGNKGFFARKNNESSRCRCNSVIRFKKHEKYKQSIKGPVSKVKAEEHPMNSAYLRLRKQMNYLDNNGFVFSYVVVKNKECSVQVLKQYPLVTQTHIDQAGGLIFDYIERFNDQ